MIPYIPKRRRHRKTAHMMRNTAEITAVRRIQKYLEKLGVVYLDTHEIDTIVQYIDRYVCKVRRYR